MRDRDVFARYGGDEFAVLLPESGRDETAEVMQRLCLSAAAQPVDLGDGPMAITVSAGIVTLASKDSLDALLARADHALYQAKKTGAQSRRNDRNWRLNERWTRQRRSVVTGNNGVRSEVPAAPRRPPARQSSEMRTPSRADAVP